MQKLVKNGNFGPKIAKKHHFWTFLMIWRPKSAFSRKIRHFLLTPIHPLSTLQEDENGMD